jgi:hypothetical protein
MMASLTTPEAGLSDRGPPSGDRISMPLSAGRQRALDHVEAGSSACDDRPAQMRAIRDTSSLPGLLYSRNSTPVR